MPTAGLAGCDGLFPPETEFGRVSGNNVVSWAPSIHDWYETVKLNYGHDFSTGRDTGHLPGPDAHEDTVPDTWRKMDAVLSFWQQMGVGGFRVDMAHIVPLEFWRWAIKRSRSREAAVFFMAEAYDNDPSKLTDGNVLDALLQAGFDAVYDDPTYDLIHRIYDGPKWANDIDALTRTGDRHNASLRYAENHDEIRLANPGHWGGLGMKVGRPVSAILFGIGGGPVMVYNGQEVGEPAIGAEGFSGDDARTSIFDYWSQPELCKWVNGHAYDGGRLSDEQQELRAWYAALLRVIDEPALRHGWFYGLNHANGSNPDFGRLDGETVSGHWLYAFLRSERKPDGQNFLVVVNLHGTETMKTPRVRIPPHALQWMAATGETAGFRDRLATDWETEVPRADLPGNGLVLPDLPPCTALYLEMR
jgi:glycosidase